MLLAEQNRLLDSARAVEWLIDYGRLFELAQERDDYLGESTILAYRLLQQVAARLLDALAEAGEFDLARLRRDQIRRQSVVVRHS